MSELKEETTINIIEAEEPAEKGGSEESAKTEVTEVKEKDDAASEVSGQGSESGTEMELAEQSGETETSEPQEKSDAETEESAEAPAAPAFDADAYLEQLAEAKRSITAGIVISRLSVLPM